MSHDVAAFAAKRRAAAPLLLGAGVRRRRSMSCPRGAQQQTRRTPQRLSNDGTVGLTDAVSLHRLCSA